MDRPTDGESAWVEQTTAYDRVQSVASTVSQPRSAKYIADESRVSEVAAREYLERLSDLNVLLKSEQDGPAIYSPDPLYTRMQAMRELLEEHDYDDLIELRSELNSQIEEWRAEYDVGSVNEIQKDPVEGPDAREWRLVAYRHSIVEEAIEWVEGRSQ